ncbi:MAG: hypothetical protein A3H27_17510 [Acidobacteria bacterium RIFCSPLOWO2_02_FULL_59_13]|nr:MAG: hypothetical protein A3H27_17510 [Acidobacteria bacterium RIFCSPLOWO2_02_FULL_59_13]
MSWWGWTLGYVIAAFLLGLWTADNTTLLSHPALRAAELQYYHDHESDLRDKLGEHAGQLTDLQGQLDSVRADVSETKDKIGAVQDDLSRGISDLQDDLSSRISDLDTAISDIPPRTDDINDLVFQLCIGVRRLVGPVAFQGLLDSAYQRQAETRKKEREEFRPSLPPGAPAEPPPEAPSSCHE